MFHPRNHVFVHHAALIGPGCKTGRSRCIQSFSSINFIIWEVRFWYLRGPQGVNGVSSMAKMDIFTEGFSEELHNLFTKDYAALSSY